jgi:hypothetical protein
MERFPAIAFLVLCVSFPVLGQTPDRTVEGKTQGESAIRQLMEDLTVAWNKHEVVSFSMVFVKDADFTNQKAGIRGITSRLPAISALCKQEFYQRGPCRHHDSKGELQSELDNSRIAARRDDAAKIAGN